MDATLKNDEGHQRARKGTAVKQTHFPVPKKATWTKNKKKSDIRMSSAPNAAKRPVRFASIDSSRNLPSTSIHNNNVVENER